MIARLNDLDLHGAALVAVLAVVLLLLAVPSWLRERRGEQ